MSSKNSSKIIAITAGLISLVLASWSMYSYLRVNSLEQQVADLSMVKSVNGPLELQVVKQQMTIDSLSRVNEQGKMALQALHRYSDSAEGVFFEVQLGQFSDFSLEQYRNNLVNLREDEVEELKVITLGRFNTQEEAGLLLADIKRLGMKRAFITGRIDGRIVSLDEAEAALK